jgi:hypothetical protein
MRSLGIWTPFGLFEGVIMATGFTVIIHLLLSFAERRGVRLNV